MKYRKLGKTEIDVSEIGFGVWTVATDWWGKIDNEMRVKLLQNAFDLGINLFDTADAYGDGFGEELLATALGDQRHDIIIATKFGYDIYDKIQRVGHKERHQRFDSEFVRYACEQSLRRLRTDYIDLYQIHNPKVLHLEDDELFNILELLKEEGKIREWGVAIGPDIGWYEEGEVSMRERQAATAQIMYSILEQEPARSFFPIAEETNTGLLSRVPHASGLLDGSFDKDTVFEPSDHRSHRAAEWLDKGLKKLTAIQFVTEETDATMGQIALQFALSGTQIATVLPNITNMTNLEEFVAAPDTEEIPRDYHKHLLDLFDINFKVEVETQE